MKWTKRITALVLCFFLVSSGTISAFEEAGFFDNVDATLEESQAKTIEGCAECGLLEGHTEDCSLYVRQETQPEDEISWIPSCDCDYAGESGLSGHTDSCARKSFVRNELIKNYSTEELYAMWDGLESEIQEAVLTFLSWDDYSKYTELKDLLDNGPAQGGEEEEEEELVFSSDDVDGVSLGIFAPEGRFPSGTTVEITPVEHSRSEERDMENTLETFLGDDYTVENLGVKMMDITFTHEGEVIQPEGAVYVTFELDEDEIDEDANTLTVFHFDDDGDAEIVANQRIDDLDDVSVTVETDRFSRYAVLTAQKEYQPTLLRDYLAGNERYSLVEFPVTLNDFDAVAYNERYGSDGLRFMASDGESSGKNSGAKAATQGLVQATLSTNGYPITDGADRGEILFGAGPAVGKTAYSNVDFEFIYNEDTDYYIYNSGANHAQLDNSDPTDPKVRLYADTVAPFNYLLDVKDVTYAEYYHSSQVRGDNYNTITITDPIDSPYVFRYLLRDEKASINTNTYKAFYLRMRFIGNKGNIIAQVTYDGGTANAQTVNYTLELQLNQWTDYVFGDFPEGRTLTQIQFFLPQANKNDYLQYDISGFLRRGGSSLVNTSGLYPFTDITNSYAGGGGEDESAGFNLSAWKERIAGTTSANFGATRVATNSTVNGPYLSDAYAYFALAMEVEFYIPNDGKVNGQDIMFHFDGDDDLWVFIDGKLALDIGGAHTAVSGWINFTDNETYVANARTKTATASDGEASRGTLTNEQVERGEYHTMKIFYMERAGTNSNCLIKFNLPVVPTGDVNVEKNVVEADGIDVPDDLTFTFVATVEGVAHANKSYTLYTKDSNGIFANPVKKTTDAYGVFELMDGQRAIFEQIDENKTVWIGELAPEYAGEAYICTSTKANGGSQTQTIEGKKYYFDEKTTSANGNAAFRFVNTYETALTDIIIEKTLLGMPASLENVENQTFLFHVKGTDTYTKDVDLTVAINISPDDVNWKDSVTIKDVPVGTYTVTEITDWSWRYEPKTGDGITDTKTVKRDKSNNTFSFTNDRADPYWLSGDCYCENWWNGSSVTEKEKRKDVWPSNN